MHASKIISGLALPLALAVTAATGPAMGRLRWQPWPTGSRPGRDRRHCQRHGLG